MTHTIKMILVVEKRRIRKKKKNEKQIKKKLTRETSMNRDQQSSNLKGDIAKAWLFPSLKGYLLVTLLLIILCLRRSQLQKTW